MRLYYSSTALKKYLMYEKDKRKVIMMFKGNLNHSYKK